MKRIPFVFLVIVLFSCNSEIKRPEAPDDLIPRDSMVLILKEMIVLETYISTKYPQSAINPDLLKNSGDDLLKTHRVSFERWDRSMNYYSARQSEMQSIYTEIQDSLIWKMNQLQQSK